MSTETPWRRGSRKRGPSLATRGSWAGAAGRRGSAVRRLMTRRFPALPPGQTGGMAGRMLIVSPRARLGARRPRRVRRRRAALRTWWGRAPGRSGPPRRSSTRARVGFVRSRFEADALTGLALTARAGRPRRRGARRRRSGRGRATHRRALGRRFRGRALGAPSRRVAGAPPAVGHLDPRDDGGRRRDRGRRRRGGVGAGAQPDDPGLPGSGHDRRLAGDERGEGRDRSGAARDRPVAATLGPSFPSGHSSTAAAFFAALALLAGRRRSAGTRAALAAAAVGIAVAVACSRVMLDLHWPSDVVAGLALGWAWFAACAIAFGGWLLEFGAPVERSASPGGPARVSAAGRPRARVCAAAGARPRHRPASARKIVTSARRPSSSTIPIEFSKVGPARNRHRTAGMRTPARCAARAGRRRRAGSSSASPSAAPTGPADFGTASTRAGAPGCGPVASPQGHLCHVGVVHVAAHERHGCGRRSPAAPLATSRSRSIIRTNDAWNAGQCSRSRARRMRSPTHAAGRPQAPAHTASLHASR